MMAGQVRGGVQPRAGDGGRGPRGLAVRAAGPRAAAGRRASALSQSVLLALMQQLGSDLAHVRPARSFPTRPALPLQLPPTVLHATVCAALLASVVLHAANHLCGEDSVNK